MRQVDTSHLHNAPQQATNARGRLPRRRWNGLFSAHTSKLRARLDLGGLLLRALCKANRSEKLWMRHLEDPKVARCDPAQLASEADIH